MQKSGNVKSLYTLVAIFQHPRPTLFLDTNDQTSIDNWLYTNFVVRHLFQIPPVATSSGSHGQGASTLKVDSHAQLVVHMIIKEMGDFL